MTEKRKQHSGQFKLKVALEAAKGGKTISQLASETGVHRTQIGQWKRQLLEEGAELFSRNGSRSEQAAEELQTELYEQIGRLKMELHPEGPRLKKKATHFS